MYDCTIFGSVYQLNDVHTESEEDFLTVGEMRQIMSNTREPITAYRGVFVWLTLLCGIIPTFHWISEPDPALIAQYGEAAVRAMRYNGKVADVIAGMPSWVFASLIWCVVLPSFEWRETSVVWAS